MPTRRFVFGFAAILLLFVEILIAAAAKGFVREHIGDALAVIFVYMLARVFFPQKPRFMSAIAFGTAVAVELFQLTPLCRTINNKNGVLSVIVGGTFDYRDIICYFLGALVCFLVDLFIIGKSKKISG